MITVIKPTWNWLDLTEDTIHLMEKHIEKCGRTCYKSEARITDNSAEKFVSKICRNKHESVLEHAILTARIVCSRSCSHQLVRHRIGAYCLSGDSEVVAFSGGKCRSPNRWSMKQLYDWSLNPKMKGRLKLIRLRSLDKEGRLVPGKIRKVFYSGEQEVFEVKTKFGRSIKATAKHRFLTEKGWKPLSDITAGDKLFSNGVPAHKNPEWIQKHYLQLNKTRKEVAALAGVSEPCLGKWIKEFGLQKPHSNRPNRQPGRGVKGMHTEEEKAKISARMKGERNHRWKGNKALANAGRLRAQKLHLIRNKCETCDSTGRIVRHHIDGNTYNNRRENIMFLCECCHSQWHTGHAVMSVFKDEILSIQPAGTEHTYDIEMEGPNHNFVANGLVVHNSQESQRYVNYGKKGMQVVCPPSVGLPVGSYELINGNVWRNLGTVEHLTDRQLRWLTTMEMCYHEYLSMMDSKYKPEDARYVLPNAAKTEVVASYNLRTWRHIINERALNKHAQWEIRGIFSSIYEELKVRLPSVFGDLE